MSQSGNNFDIEKESKRIMLDWESWRPVLVQLDSMLLWDRPADPGIIVGVTSTLFFMCWYLDPPIITILASVGLVLTLLDFAMPALSAQLFQAHQGSNKQWERICRNLAYGKQGILYRIRSCSNLRKTQPKIFYAAAIPLLFVLAWLGNTFSNVLMTYIVVMSALLVPGLERRGTFNPILKFLPECCQNKKEARNKE